MRFTKSLVLSDDDDAANDNGDDECEFLEADERVVRVQYLAELDCVVIACASGTIATVNASTLQVRPLRFVFGCYSDPHKTYVYSAITASTFHFFSGGFLIACPLFLRFLCVNIWFRIGELQIELVGCATGGIACAAWSPDFEVLAICTHSPTGTCPNTNASGGDDAASLLLMSSDWTLLAEAAVSAGNSSGGGGRSSRGVALSWRGDGMQNIHF